MSVLAHLAATANVNCLGNATCDTGLPQVQANSTSVQTILQIVFGAIGAIAVIIIMLAALKFVTARGNPQETATARSTIIYAAIGLAVAVSAEAIVSFVLNGL